LKKLPTLLVVFFTVFLDLLGFGIIIPIQSFYAEQFGATPTTITLLGASYSLMQFLFSSFWGRLSDRIGRRPIVLISVSFSAVAFLVFGLAQSLAWLFAARLLAGFGNANIGAVQAIISDITTPENRAKGMGVLGAAFGLGFILGPAIGGIMGQISPQAPAFTAAGLAFCNLVLAFFILPETLGAHRARRSRLNFKSFKHAMSQVNVGTIIIANFIFTAAFAMMEQAIGLFIARSHLGAAEVHGAEYVKQAAQLTAIYLVAVGVTATIVQGGLIGRLNKRFGEVRLATTGLLIVSLGMAFVPYNVGQMPGMWMLISAIVLAAGTGISGPSLSSLLSRSVSTDEQGGTLGLNQSMSSLGRVIGPGFAGMIFEWNMAAMFYISAGLIGLAWLASLRLQPIPGQAANRYQH
jgi:DHA1 family tetracycline resistance protein-like MFS transporter